MKLRARHGDQAFTLRLRAFAERKITAHNISSTTNAFSTTQGLNQIARMLADGKITARIRSTVGLDGAAQIIEKLRSGGLRGKAVIRL